MKMKGEVKEEEWKQSKGTIKRSKKRKGRGKREERIERNK
jgi:hypothetical protein